MNEYQCTRCHTLIHSDAPPKVCPTCGGTQFTQVERDHRGIALPSRSPVGGIITPQ
jgi:RNA polymerase subunit RPABC4/transcription elongation factor Spt4